MRKRKRFIVIQGVKYRRLTYACNGGSAPMLEVTWPGGLKHYMKPTKSRIRALRKVIEQLTLLTNWLEKGR